MKNKQKIVNICLPGVDGKKRFWNFKSNDFCWFCFTCHLNKSRMCSMICIGKLWSDAIMKSCWININIKCQVLVFFVSILAYARTCDFLLRTQQAFQWILLCLNLIQVLWLMKLTECHWKKIIRSNFFQKSKFSAM